MGKDKKVAIVGRFPFTARLREPVGELTILEKDPQPGEHSEADVVEIFSASDVITIAGMTFITNSLERLLVDCQRSSFVMVLGPSTPISPILLDYGVI